jgi:DNA polymerase-3 subunit epsilon
MLLFIDTETSGLPDFTLPLTHPSQPRVVQLAAWLGEEYDEGMLPPEQKGALRHHSSLNAIIRPAPGATIHPAAERVHGISLERARAVGEDLGDVLRRLYELVALASTDDPASSTLVAHNLPFDNNMLLIESAHAGFDPTPLSYLRPFCTMRALTTRMKLPGRYPGKYKWPNLAEAHRFCLGRDFDDAHSAMGDVLACRDIYIHGRTEGWWP